MSEYYKILGINQNASEEEIKQAYRKLARTHHPDKGGDKDKFQKIQEAYEMLTNPDKKINYNNHQNAHNFSFNFNNHSFFDFHNQHHQHHQQNNGKNKIQKKDFIYNFNIKLKDVYFGINKKLKLSRKIKCSKCVEMCDNCDGNGVCTKSVNMGPFQQIITQNCSNCSSSGIIKKNTECDLCENGEITESNVVEINVPIGVEDKKQIIFKGWGEQARNKNELSGNFLVIINIEKDDLFEKKQKDLIFTVELSLKESLIGKQIIIPHFSEDLHLNTSGFGIINPNIQYTIFNKGLRDTNDKHGQLHLRFKINYPSKTLDEIQINAFKELFEKCDL